MKTAIITLTLLVCVGCAMTPVQEKSAVAAWNIGDGLIRDTIPGGGLISELALLAIAAFGGKKFYNKVKASNPGKIIA